MIHAVPGANQRSVVIREWPFYKIASRLSAGLFASLTKKLGTTSWTLPGGRISVASPGKSQADAEAIANMIHELEPFIPASAVYRTGELPVVLEVSSVFSHEMGVQFLHENGTTVVLKVSREALRYCCQHNTSAENLASRVRFAWAFPRGNIALLADTERNGALCGCSQALTWDKFFNEDPEPSPFDASITEHEPFGCALLCDEGVPQTSRTKLVAYPESGERVIQHMCKPCVRETLETALASFLRPQIDVERPPCLSRFAAGARVRIPLGLVLSSLCQEDNAFRELITRWFDSMYQHAANHCHSFVQTCPNHPGQKLLRVGGKSGLFCQVPGCSMKLCSRCREWHPADKISHKSPLYCPSCPKCRTMTVKSGGCSHIACPCGQHWCYKCGRGFQSAAMCYVHMLGTHGSYGFD
jgi:hypothetical protein